MAEKPTAFNWRIRAKAAAVHALLSVFIGILLLILLFLGWYPGVLMDSMGVGHIVLILMGVDLALGPLLTFAVFNPHKKSLKMDLAVILAVQLTGLFYGLHTIYQGRPAWIVFVQDRFETTRPADVDKAYTQKTLTPSSWLRPVWAATPLMDHETKSIYFTKMMQGEPDVGQRVNMFQPLTDRYQEVKSVAKPISELQKFNAAAEVRKIISLHPGYSSWLPLQAAEKYQVVLLPDEASHPPIIVPLKPW